MRHPTKKPHEVLIPIVMPNLPKGLPERKEAIEALLSITPQRADWNDQLSEMLSTLEIHESAYMNFLNKLFPEKGALK